jgi:hypothetical protein
MCKCVLPPGVYPIVVDKYIIAYWNILKLNRKFLHYQIFLLLQLITSMRSNFFFFRTHQVFQEVKSVEFFIHASKQVVNRFKLSYFVSVGDNS